MGCCHCLGGKEKVPAINRYRQFVVEGVNRGPLWEDLVNQIYLGDKRFIAKAQARLAKLKPDVNIPKAQTRPKAKTLAEYDNGSKSRDKAIVMAYNSGACSYKDIADYFGLHFTTVGKIVRQSYDPRDES